MAVATVLSLLKSATTSPQYFQIWAALAWILDVFVTFGIIWKIPFTNVDWETYMVQVNVVAGGEFDYAKVRGPTGPIAYPGGFVWFYAALGKLNLGILGTQVVFALLYLITLGVVLEIYRSAGAPGWLAVLCVLSKRVHSIFVLRLFNDAVAQLLAYSALLALVRDRPLLTAVLYSLAVSVKMQPLLVLPAVGLVFVLSLGWRRSVPMVAMMGIVQVAVGLPFIAVDAEAYFLQAYGGPGDLQHAWSVNWRWIPEDVFYDRKFGIGCLAVHVLALLFFAQKRWIPGGFLGERLWRWSTAVSLDRQAIVCVWFACNFVGVCCLRTIHFQFLVWYFHSVPFLAWFALQPDRYSGITWVVMSGFVAALVLAVEVPYLLTGRDVVRGPDGRTWETDGTPTKVGSCMLVCAHATLLALLAARGVSWNPVDKAPGGRSPRKKFQ